MNNNPSQLILLALISNILAYPAYSQTIMPAKDGTGTIIRQQGNQYNIEGGSFSQDQRNLFHSFQQFNVPVGQTANFITQPQLQNILGKVTGGNASFINGLIQVTGGSANLFLINPAGVIFGPNASLNVPNAFNVSTATGLGFANNQWLNVLGPNNYAGLLGNPQNFAFGLSQPGIIINQGDLSVQPDKNISLFGGMVLNTGKLSTQGGNVTIVAIPGGNILEISQPGHLLNLQVQPLGEVTKIDSVSSIQPLSLPNLLTGNNTANQANSLTINELGQVVLTGTKVEITEKSGTAIASGSIDVSNKVGLGGQVTILGDRIGVVNSQIQTNGNDGGGTVLIGGDFQGQGNIFKSQETFVNNNSVIQANAQQLGNGGQVIIWSDGQTNFTGNIQAIAGRNGGNGGLVEISGKQDLVFRGNVDVSAVNGQIGNILFDPENITIDQVTDSSQILESESIENITENTTVDLFSMDGDYNITFDANNINKIQGAINLQADNDITVNQAINTNQSVQLTAGRSININADIDTSTGNGNISLFANSDLANISNRATGAANIQQLDGTSLNAGTGNITLQLGDLGQVGNIYLANLTSQGTVKVNANTGNILATSANNLIKASNLSLNTLNNSSIGLLDNPLKIEVNNLEAIAGEKGLFINANSNLTVSKLETKEGGAIKLDVIGDLTVNNSISTATDLTAGDITINTTGKINSQSAPISANSLNGKAGNIKLTADQNIITENITANSGKIIVNNTDGLATSAEGGNGDGGTIALTAGTNIKVGNISSHSILLGDGGVINLTANGNITTGEIKSQSGYQAIDQNTFGQGNSGNITLTSQQGAINTGEIISNTNKGNTGNVNITADQNIVINGTSNSISTNALTGQAGSIKIDSNSGNITVKSGIVTEAKPAQAGSLTIKAAKDINLAEINLRNTGDKNSGDLTINSQTGKVNISSDVNLSTDGMGNGGKVNITANQDIILNGIKTNNPMAGNGGNVTLVSKEGNVNIQGDINASSTNIGGQVNINAQGDIGANNIFTYGLNKSSGDLLITSQTGDINISENKAQVRTNSMAGIPGNVQLTAQKNITTGAIFTSSINGDRSGNITMKSQAGNINTTAGDINLAAMAGQPGTLTLESPGNINIGNIQADGLLQGGEVKITSDQGAVSMAPNTEINTSATQGLGGNVDITGYGLLQIEAINAEGSGEMGLVNLTSINNDVNTTTEIKGIVNITAYNGNVNLEGPQNINIKDGGKDNPFTETPSENIVTDADQINSSSQSQLELNAQNDININENIKTNRNIKDFTLRAGRNIKVNADIDTSAGNGNITLAANQATPENPFRLSGTGNIFMAEGTKLKAGQGDINLLLGTADLNNIGNIVISNLTTTGQVNINAFGGNILAVSPHSLIKANSVIFQTKDIGSVGNQENPLQIQVNNLEGNTGSGGIFILSPAKGLIIGNDNSNDLSGIQSTGDLEITAKGDITLKEPITISSSGTVVSNIILKSLNGSIDSSSSAIKSGVRDNNSANTTENQSQLRIANNTSPSVSGNISLEADKNIITQNISTNATGTSNSGNIILKANGNIDTTAGLLSSQVIDGQAGEINITATGNILTGKIASHATGTGRGGNVVMNSDGQINTTEGLIQTGSDQSQIAGSVLLNAQDNIIVGVIDAATRNGQSGDVNITSSQGMIDAQGRISSRSDQNGGNISLQAQGNIEIKQEIISQADAKNPQGEAGNISLISETGNITVNNSLYSKAANGGKGGNITLKASGEIKTTGKEITTFSREKNNTTGTGGNILIEADGPITITNLIESSGLEKSGDVKIISKSGVINTRSILTRASNGESGNIILNTYNHQGNIQTADLTTIGNQAAGKVEVIATDGNIITENITSQSDDGKAGGIDLSGNDIMTGDQTVISAVGDSNITNQAKGSLFVGNQRAIANQGDANIMNTAAGNVTVANQTATTNIGNANITNTAKGNVTTGNQAATTNNGNAIINNTAGGILTTGNQSAIAVGGNNQIINNAGQIITGITAPPVNQMTNSTNNSNPVITNNVPINPVTPVNIVSPNLPIANNPVINSNPVTFINTPNLGEMTNTLPINNQNPVINTVPVNIPNPIITNLPLPVTPNPVIPNTLPHPNINGAIAPIPNQIPSQLTTQQIQNQVISLSNDLNVSPFNNYAPAIINNGNIPIASINSQEKNILQNISTNHTSTQLAANTNTLNMLEESRTQEFTNYFGKDLLKSTQPTTNIRDVLGNIAKQTGHNSAILYINAYAEGLQIVLYTANGETILKNLPDVDQKTIIQTINEFREEILNPRQRHKNLYLTNAQTLYSWLIAPLKEELEKNQIDNILFSLGDGLRGLPLAALHDGQQFLIEKYSLSVIPNLALIDTNYRSMQGTQVLAMGASEFEFLNKLPAVPTELKTITKDLWTGQEFLNKEFTLNNLVKQRQIYPYQIIHLATHAEFQPGLASNSFIQLWQKEKLQLDQIRQLGWNNPPVELLVLSACRTAIGDPNAELGFAGLAIATGAKSALASLWYVSDAGTLGLMTEFYTHLQNATIKADALRQAQLAMLQGKVSIEGGELRGSEQRGGVLLPPEITEAGENTNFSHPFYWSGFTMIGSPW